MRTIENCLIGLHAIKGLGTRHAEKAQSLLGWYNERGELTKKQIDYAYQLIGRSRSENRRAERKTHYLYAISDGRNVKIGYSVSPKSRRRELQTGCPSKLTLEWSFDVGESKMIAAKKERKLHRYCRKYHVHGEWFKKGCMILVAQFEVRERAEREAALESEENQILINAMACI